VRRRIVSVTVLCSVLCTLVFAVPLAIMAAVYLQGHERSEVVRIADAVASASADNIASGRRLAISERRTAYVAVSLYDGNGALTSGVAVPGADALVGQALARDDGEATISDDIAVAVPVIERGVVIGAVLVLRPQSSLRSRVGLVWLLLALLSASAIALTWLFARGQAGRLSRPVEALAIAVDRLGHGDFDARGPTVGIAEIDSVTESMAHTSNQLRVLLERERALAGHASHQIRTPLTGLRLLLERAAADPDDRAAEVQAALALTAELERTVTDMLQLVRGPRLSVESLDLDSLVEHIQTRWSETFASSGRPLEIQAGSENPDVHISPGAVRQILNVLLDNAGVHGSGTVTVAIRHIAGTLAVDVAQQGPPLSVPVPALFAETPATRRGSGIGLALARSIAQAAGARLIVSSSDPPTFTLLIPAARTQG
jgi:signal transduction histidine kinase